MDNTKTNSSKFKRTQVYEIEGGPLIVGDELPNLILESASGTVHLHDYIKSHLIVALISTSCNVCEDALEAIYEYISQNPEKLNILILLNANALQAREVQKIMDKSAVVINVTLEMLLKGFKTTYLPLGFAVDGEGRIKSIEAFSNRSKFESLITPIFDREKV
ncbi:hypothetical protein ACFQ88_22480 [Paenibacillus sp. NPDC056579]|uniref:hypothetical protein n=1 Tax=Paenibacillus sp. NPDC056579 TaxID=3345871 RepID=UPI00368C7E07